MRYQIIIFLVFFFSEAKSQATIFSNYSELNDQFDQVKVVMLGEIHHNDQKSMIEKVELIKFLHDSLGFDILAFESSIYDMSKANQLLAEDIETALYSGIFPIWHYTESIDSLISTFRTRNFTLAGFDNQICSGGGDVCLEFVTDLEGFLVRNNITYQKRTTESLIKEIKSFKSNNYTFSDDFDPSLLKEIIFLAEAIKSARYPESVFWYQNLISIHGLFFDYYHNKLSQKTEGTFKPFDSNLRDSLMASNVMYLMEKFPKSKIICWGATYHFANKVNNLILAGYDFSQLKPMGYYLKKEYGDKVKIVGFTDIGKADAKEALLENVNLFRNEKAIYQFSENSIGKSSFLKYAPYPEGEWSNVIDVGVIINSEGPIRLQGKVVSPESSNRHLTPVPYTLIQIAGTTKGSVANASGEFELIIEPEFINRDVIFTSLGYEPTILKVSQVKDEILIFEKAELLDGIVVMPNQNDPLEIVKNLSANRIKAAPNNPFSVAMYNYQEEENNQSNEVRIREAALQYYYENRLRENELRLSNILNYRSVTKEVPNNLWPYAPFHADFQSGYGFTIDQTFKKLQIDSVYSYEKDKRLSVVQYTHLKPTYKVSGFGLATEWRGKIIFDSEKMEIRSHFKELYFKKNEDYGLYHISFNIEYFNYQGFVFPRLMTTNYQFKNKDGSVRNGKERMLITDIELENPQKPINRIGEYDKATSDVAFWKTFNTILVEEK